MCVGVDVWRVCLCGVCVGVDMALVLMEYFLTCVGVGVAVHLSVGIGTIDRFWSEDQVFNPWRSATQCASAPSC